MKGKVFVTRNNFKDFKKVFEEEVKKDASCVFLVIDDYSDKDISFYHDYFNKVLLNNVLCVRNLTRLGVNASVNRAKTYFKDKGLEVSDIFISGDDEYESS